MRRGFGFTWGVGGWLLFNFLQRAGEEQIRRMRQRIVDEVRTTFASRYAATISLADVLNPATIAPVARLGIRTKVLINPTM